MRNPTLTGRVTVKLHIDALGRVPEAWDGGSELPDVEVARRFASEAKKLSFPPPEAGSARVAYPFLLSPP